MTRGVLFLLFFLSGFCGLVYQVVWTRLAFAAFGIVTPVLSIVISVFMLGLAVGSWAAGAYVGPLVGRTGWSAMRFYALAELTIGLGAFAVPRLFKAGEHLLLSAGDANSVTYLTLSGLVLAVSVLPWCVCMGATFPLVIAFIRERDPCETGGFSFLYLANVLGAMTGTLVAAIVLIELLGFHQTLWVAAVGNFTIAIISLALASNGNAAAAIEAPIQAASAPHAVSTPISDLRRKLTKWSLFSTGFVSLAMEVVWTRAFTPVLKTQVYSFALVVYTYLGATFIGSCWYRRHRRKDSVWSLGILMGWLIISVFIPLIALDPRWVKMEWAGVIDPISAVLVLLSICPFCALLGYLTPSLVDEYSGGDAATAGEAYALNVLGCILGPLLACYVLLPHLSERASIILLAVPFILLFLRSWHSMPPSWRLTTSAAAAATAACALLLSGNFQQFVAKSSNKMVVRRDYAASVIAADPPDNKILLVNGMGMTYLTPITKFMVHFPLALRRSPAESVLVICFGMGTSYRSALSWGVDTTAVELVPGVVESFGFYHADAEACSRNPRGHLTIDDGRRFLRRTSKKYDLIVVDPPPPVSAAGSSLLFSKEFCSLAREHLKPGGMLQIWFPDGTPDHLHPEPGAAGQSIEWSSRRKAVAAEAVFRSLTDTFPHVRAFLSVEKWGVHLLASDDPIVTPSVEQMVARMPNSAKKDLMEWNAKGNPTNYLTQVLTQEIPMQSVLKPNLQIAITDDRPMNEYFLLRQAGFIGR
jgi:predicted membrane-bound spermidine synthase